MEIVFLVLAATAGLFSIGCALTTAFEIASGKMRFPWNASFWGAVIFHVSTALLALWLVGLWLGK